jgi:hypothetical protein
MPILIPVFDPARPPCVRPRAISVPIRRSPGVRAFALGLALTLTLFLVATSGHRHDSQLDKHVCAICNALASEIPCTGTLPAIAASTPAHAYVLTAVIAYMCWYRRPALMPPSCGPP